MVLLPDPPIELAPLPYSTQSELLPNVTESGWVASTAPPVANTAVVKDVAPAGETSRADAPRIAVYVATAIKSCFAWFDIFPPISITRHAVAWQERVCSRLVTL